MGKKVTMECVQARSKFGLCMCVFVTFFLQVLADVCPQHCQCLDKGSVVSCIHSKLTHIPPLISSTIVLDLDYNSLVAIQNDSFHGGSRIEVLSMANNKIRRIANGAFVKLPKLDTLNLGSNSLNKLPKDLFWNNGDLRILDLHDNRFISIPEHVMYPLHMLELLNMSHNLLASPKLGPGFKFTTQLSSVDLSWNQFDTLDDDAFSSTLWWDEEVRHYINLSYCDIRHFHPNAMSRLFRVEVLSLEGNSNISKTDLRAAFKDLEASSLQILSLSRMNITDISEYFKHLQHQNLRQLDLSFNVIENLQHRSFYYLVNLQNLDLSHNKLKSIGDLSGLSKVELINMAYNQISTIEGASFDGTPLLRTLNLSHNLLSTIEGPPFQQLWDLQTLDVSCNQISALNINSGLENLQNLLIASNTISNFNFIRLFPQLKKLDISHNLITRLNGDVFAKGQHLLLVNFSHNFIVSIDNSAFQSAVVETIDLSHNQLTKVEKFGWTRTRKLFLNGNHIQNISSDSFEGLIMLLELDLSYNHLHSLPRASFNDLGNLQTLQLSQNPIGAFLETHDGIQLMRTIRQLENLYISNINLPQLPNSWLNHMATLLKLDLSCNTIKQLTQSSLGDLLRLEELNLSSNLLENLSELTFTSVPRLSIIDLSHNPFFCSCSLMPFRRWLISTTGITVLGLIDHGKYTCHGPPEWKGVSLQNFHLQSETCSHTELVMIFTACAGFLLAVAIAVMVFFFKKKCKKQTTRKELEQETDTEDGLYNSLAVHSDGTSSINNSHFSQSINRNWV